MQKFLYSFNPLNFTVVNDEPLEQRITNHAKQDLIDICSDFLCACHTGVNAIKEFTGETDKLAESMPFEEKYENHVE